MRGRNDFVIINNQRFFDLLDVHYKRSDWHVLSGIRHQIENVNKIAPIALGEGGKNPDGIGEWMLRKMAFWREKVAV